MRRPSLIGGALLGGILSLPIVALTYLGQQVGSLPFVPFDYFDWMARHLPGPILTLAISTMVKVISGLHLGPTAATAKAAEQTLAIIQFIVASAVLGVIVAALTRWRPAFAQQFGLLAGGLALVLSTLVEASLGFPQAGFFPSVLWMAILFMAAGWLFGRWASYEAAPPEAADERTNTGRRRFLAWVGGGSAALALAAWGASRMKTAPPIPNTSATATPTAPVGVNPGTTGGPAASPPEAVLAQRFPPAPGTRPELTSTADFYRIDINVDIPTTDMNTWRLVLDGLVDHPLSLTLDQIRSYPAVSQVATLSCISNYIGGDLISTAEFTGVPFKTILDAAGLKPEGRFFNINAFDGFYESLGIDEASDPRTLLVFEMNGEPLPPEHGFPLRIYIPGHYGMKQPKWIEHIAVSDTPQKGYWVERGWNQLATVKTTSAIDAVSPQARDSQTGNVPVGGIAYSGERGISKVEIQMDSGPWMPAELRTPPLSPLTWVQWRFAAPYSTGRHVFRVRAYDGTGAVQTDHQAPPEPDGATGLHSVSADF